MVLSQVGERIGGRTNAGPSPMQLYARAARSRLIQSLVGKDAAHTLRLLSSERRGSLAMASLWPPSTPLNSPD